MNRSSHQGVKSLARLTVLFAFVAPPGPLLSGGHLSSAGLAAQAAEKPMLLARLSSHRRHQADRPPAGTASSADETSEDDTVGDGAISAALAACDKGSGKTETLSLPGAKGEVKLDRCYRGRDQLVCSLNTLSAEAKALTEDFARIVEASYPNVSSVDAVCGIAPDALVANLQKASSFAPRFNELRNAYDRRIKCAAKVEQSLRDVSLADMPRSEDLLKSMNDTLQGDMKDVAAARQRIFDLAEKMDASRKAMVIIQKIRRTLCLSTAGEKPVNATQETPVIARPDSDPSVSATPK
jgi:hypothetical protein